MKKPKTKEAPSTTIRRLRKELRDHKKAWLSSQEDIASAIQHLAYASQGKASITLDAELFCDLYKYNDFTNAATVSQEPFCKRWMNTLITRGSTGD